ncbi:hypothetical protein KI387_031945 [Taxus chinensis]|uniref:Dof-type domain-containing protein n=1 Tax=Taxus chinensis TaxID=29808 RepID=A0AA38F342_TAXCH|nr:hypothetical protein KI387_031945 [Taxus chinensis]
MMETLQGILADLRAQAVNFSCLDVLNFIKEAVQENDAYALPVDCKKFISDAFRSCKPPLCPSCKSSQHCVFRYLNNKMTARSIQPRFCCHNCKKNFTLGGNTYAKISIDRKRKNLVIAAGEGENCDNKSIRQCIPQVLWSGESSGNTTLNSDIQTPRNFLSCPPLFPAGPEGLEITHISHDVVNEDDFSFSWRDSFFDAFADSNLNKSKMPSHAQEETTIPYDFNEAAGPWNEKITEPQEHIAVNQSGQESKENSLASGALMGMYEQEDLPKEIDSKLSWIGGIDSETRLPSDSIDSELSLIAEVSELLQGNNQQLDWHYGADKTDIEGEENSLISCELMGKCFEEDLLIQLAVQKMELDCSRGYFEDPEWYNSTSLWAG